MKKGKIVAKRQRRLLAHIEIDQNSRLELNTQKILLSFMGIIGI